MLTTGRFCPACLSKIEMHRRKTYHIYPPRYKDSLKGAKACHSRLQAWKTAKKMGDGAIVNVRLCYYSSKREYKRVERYALWDIYRKITKQTNYGV